jgi:hypothetical protein
MRTRHRNSCGSAVRHPRRMHPSRGYRRNVLRQLSHICLHNKRGGTPAFTICGLAGRCLSAIAKLERPLARFPQELVDPFVAIGFGLDRVIAGQRQLRLISKPIVRIYRSTSFSRERSSAYCSVLGVSGDGVECLSYGGSFARTVYARARAPRVSGHRLSDRPHIP